MPLFSYKNIKFAIATIIPLIIAFLPLSVFNIPELTLIHQRIIAIFVLAALYWVFEIIPTYATSILVIALLVFVGSNKGIGFLMQGEKEILGTPYAYTNILQSLGSPLIFLFIGGFALATASEKYKLNYILAKYVIKPFGTNPAFVLLGLMTVTSVLSMLLSNTATTAMMLSILAPFLAKLKDDAKGKIAFVIAIPFAANIGGRGTPIGTPPNAIFLSALPEGYGVSFGEWMLFALPLTFILILLCWGLLLLFFKPSSKVLKIDIDIEDIKDPKKYFVYGVFLLTIILWITSQWNGMDSYTIALVPFALFVITGIIDKNDIKDMEWHILFLVSGGIALTKAIQSSGLFDIILSSLPLSSINPIALLVVFMIITYTLANFMSHTAASTLIAPIAGGIFASVPSIAQDGNLTFYMVILAMTASLSMILPVSTPPNALSFATGLFTQKDMAKVGLILGVIGIIFTYFYMLAFNQMGLV